MRCGRLCAVSTTVVAARSASASGREGLVDRLDERVDEPRLVPPRGHLHDLEPRKARRRLADGRVIDMHRLGRERQAHHPADPFRDERREHLLRIRMPQPPRDRDARARPLRERLGLRARDPHQRRAPDRLEAPRHLLHQRRRRRPPAPDVRQKRRQIRGGFDGPMARKKDGFAHAAHSITGDRSMARTVTSPRRQGRARCDHATSSVAPPADHSRTMSTLFVPSNPSPRTFAVSFIFSPASVSRSHEKG